MTGGSSLALWRLLSALLFLSGWGVNSEAETDLMAARRKRPSTTAAKKTVAASAAPKGSASESLSEKATFLLPVELMAELRAASVDVPPRVFGSTLSALVARGVQSGLAKLRRDWNEGEPFKRSGPIQTRKGRPPKA